MRKSIKKKLNKEIDFLFLELPFAGIGILCSLYNIYKPVYETPVKVCFLIVLLLVFIENTIIAINEYKKRKNNDRPDDKF